MRALRRSSTATATVAAAGQVTASARMPPPVLPCRRRAGRRPRTVATVAPRGTSVQSAMRALRSSSTAAATVAAAGRATASARTLLAVFHSRRRSGRRPRTVATAASSGTPSQGAMHALRGSMSAAATVAAPALATAGARTPPPIFPRGRRDGPARYFGRAPAHRGTPGQVRRSRCARSPMAAATGAAPNPGTAPPPTAFSILPAPSHRRAVYQIRAPGQVSHISTGPRASSVFHNQHRCGKRRAADALAMSIHRGVGPDPWICGKPAWHNNRPRSEFSA
ncbi:hypothetical protein BCC0238_007151 (plasmid) [Burkholderia gladioli]